jgi:hypothetical protein
MVASVGVVGARCGATWLINTVGQTTMDVWHQPAVVRLLLFADMMDS